MRLKHIYSELKIQSQKNTQKDSYTALSQYIIFTFFPGETFFLLFFTGVDTAYAIKAKISAPVVLSFRYLPPFGDIMFSQVLLQHISQSELRSSSGSIGGY